MILLVVDAAITILAVETAWLTWRWRQTGLGPAPRHILTITGAGAGLLIALHAALANVSPLVILLALSVGGALHGLDLVQRLRK